MSDITHNINIKGSQQDVYKALATIDGLAHWWTETTAGDSKPGGKIDFRFGGHLCTMRVDALEPNQRVAWECADPQGDWAKTKLVFDLQGKEGGTLLKFGHREWREQNEFFGHCSAKWAMFLLSLKQYVETGAGAPFPNDIKI